MAARGKLSVNRGGSARGGYRVETVILAALADRCGLWIRRGCQATTGTGSSKRDRGSAGCWSLGLVAGLILPRLAGTQLWTKVRRILTAGGLYSARPDKAGKDMVWWYWSLRSSN
jgi:hypothetical protein